MQNRSDPELLRDYAANSSESAFGEIVRRYADFVYSAALRQVGNGEQARDVAQMVFVDLARKAGSLRPNIVLIGWLCQGARLAALEQLRKDHRRVQRERHAMDMLDNSPDAAGEWHAVQPVLDEAIASLGHEDRDALLLRFFKNESLASVGANLGVSEDAAQKRVSRALEKLRGFLAQRGITTTAAALSAVLIANGVKAAPSGFASAMTMSALANVAAPSASFLKILTLTNVKTAVIVLAAAGGLVTLTVMQFDAQRRLREAEALIRQQAADLDALRSENERLAAQAAELAQARRDAQDVLRLRGEIAQLRRNLAARTNNSQRSAAAATNTPPDNAPIQVTVQARFIVIPETTPVSGNLNGFLTGEQYAQTSRYFENLEGAKVIGAPQITLLSGRQGEVQIGQAVPLGVGGAYTNIGLSLEVFPVCQSNSSVIELNYSAKVRRLIDASPQKDGSLLTVEGRSFTNSIRIPDGQTVVATGLIPATGPWLQGDSETDTAQNRTLMIFITPTIIDAAGNRVFGDDNPSSEKTTNASVTSGPGEGVFPGVFPGSVPAEPR